MKKKQIAALLMVALSTAARVACAQAPGNPGAGKNGALALEAENGMFAENLHVTTDTPGYSGKGYVTGIQSKKDVIDWSFSAPPGLYRLTVRFRCSSGPKAFDGVINGHGFSGKFTQSNVFTDYDAGLVEVVPGSNPLQIGGGWGWYDIDRVVLTPASTPAPPLPVPAKLSDPQATTAARELMSSLVRDYGKTTWSGQHDRSEIALIQKTTGRQPVIVSGDLIEYSPSRVEHGSKPGNTTERYIELTNSGHVLGLMWHWNAPSHLLDTDKEPWWKGFYTEGTTFDISAALADPNSPEYALLLRDIDSIAVQLKKVSDKNIPVLWRPLHEASGGWFWWGAKGPEPFKALWRLLYDRLTVHHKLHNLVWVLTNIDPKWYPGNDVVDIIGVDDYPKDATDSLQNDWQPLIAQFNGVKPIALSEFGGVPDIERMHRFGVWFAYFSPWNGAYIEKAPTATMSRIYHSPEVITLDEFKARHTSLTSNGQSVSAQPRNP
jgi:mannan endo-1,4-beta-mannosidase